MSEIAVGRWQWRAVAYWQFSPYALWSCDRFRGPHFRATCKRTGVVGGEFGLYAIRRFATTCTSTAGGTAGVMESPDFTTLTALIAWQVERQRTILVTVLATYGSAPRPPGALFAVSADGRVAGSVSGGCVEAELVERFARRWPERPEIVQFGGNDQAERLRLPCGATLELLIEPAPRPHNCACGAMQWGGARPWNASSM